MSHLFSMKHIFLGVSTASSSIHKKERKKKLEFEQSFWRDKIQWIKRMCVKLIIRNTNRCKYYLIPQLFNDVKVPHCHTENLSFENIFSPFKYSLLLFQGFIFWGTNIKGTIFSGRVRSHPSHPPPPPPPSYALVFRFWVMKTVIIIITIIMPYAFSCYYYHFYYLIFNIY